MTTQRAIEPLPPSDEPIRQALEDAHLQSLLPALAQITGDPSLLRDDLRPAPRGALDPQGELPEAARAPARDLALRTLSAWRDAGSVAAPPPSPAAARRSASCSTTASGPARCAGSTCS
jgi:4-hydroxyacetophenone monooxygenase